MSHAVSPPGPDQDGQAYHKPGLRSLRTLLALSFGGFTLALALALSLVLGETSLRQVEKQIGLSLAELAYRMQDRLDRGVVDRLKALELAAALAGPPPPEPGPARLWLVRLNTLLEDFGWIGYADASGRLQISSDGQAPGYDVSDLFWFREGLMGLYMGDTGSVPAALQAGADSLLLLDLAAPVRGADGAVRGVLAAYLNQFWALDVKQAVLEPLGRRVQVELLVLSHGGEVLLGPAQLRGQVLDLQSVRSARLGGNGYRVESWPDGNQYLTGFSRSDGFRGHQGLGWLILVRQDVDTAYFPARQLQTQVMGGGVVLGLFFALLGWLLARYIARPLLTIARVADRIRRGDNTVRIPLLSGFSELKVLSRSLDTLVSKLVLHEAELASLNANLERRVQQRTRQLQVSNQVLEMEIAERRWAEREREQLIQELQALAETDALTGVFNRRALFLRGEGEFSRARRLHRPLTVVMLDIDHFKGVNDAYGHAVGDEVIKTVATCCRATLREIDLVGRYGGEEFAVLLLEANGDAARWVAERLRVEIQKQQLPTEWGKLSVTVSLGLAELSPDTTDLAALLNCADHALYQAKRAGRNRVEVFKAAAAGDRLDGQRAKG